MAHSEAKFQITAGVIDFGERVVAMRQVAFAACSRGYPFRWPGAVLLLLATAGIGWEVLLGDGLAALKSGGSTKLWVAFVLAGVAIFGLVFQRRLLVIGLSDGSKIQLRGGNNEFQERVVACIGEALRAATGAPFHATIDMVAQSIEASAGAATSTSGARAAMSAPTTAPQGRQPTSAAIANGHADPARSLPHERMNGTAAGYARNGHAPPHDGPDARHDVISQGSMSRSMAGAPATMGQANLGVSGTWPSNAAAPAGAEPMPRILPQQAQQAAGRPVRDPSNPLRDMEALVDFVRRSDVQHKTALIELLAVVEDYLKGGATVREDAVAHWQSFSGYVHQYLATVDGLLPLTDRAGRPFATN